jgi:hypothetical protein
MKRCAHPRRLPVADEIFDGENKHRSRHSRNSMNRRTHFGLLTRRGTVACLALGLIVAALAIATTRVWADEISPRPAFPLEVSANKRHLEDQNGTPFLVVADTPWFIQKVKIEDVRAILDDRVARGSTRCSLKRWTTAISRRETATETPPSPPMTTSPNPSRPTGNMAGG